MIRIALAFICLAPITCSALGQSGSPFDNLSPPTVRGTGGMGTPVETPPTFGASAGTEILRHRGLAGNPCLAFGGSARAHLLNPNVYDHVVTVKNSCAQRITAQVCYYRSQDCLLMEVPGGERKEAILGSLPSVKDFRFEFREKF
jgi:hypothetical protein